MSEVKKKLETETIDLLDHMATLDRDTQQYDQATANLMTLTKSLTEMKTAESEQNRKEKERIQAIKQWEAEQNLKESQLEEDHLQFMVKTTVDALVKMVQSAIFVDLHDRELLFEKDDSRSFKFGGGLMSRFPFMK